VSRAHDDLQNLMIATDVGTLFLDKELRIKRFTPRMRELFNISPSDEGRRIGDFTNRLDYPDFEKDATQVMEQNRHVEREICTVEDRWFRTHLGPYRTVDGKTEGIVATFVDITERKRTEDKLRETEGAPARHQSQG
jgi:two-component system CheB/CheR fusion protein